MQLAQNIAEETISAVKLDSVSRPNFLPSHFGTLSFSVESEIYSMLTSMSDGYSGGFWEFYELSNGGMYMAPIGETPLHLSWPDNFFDGDLTPDAAGIVACLMAFSHLSFQSDDSRLVLVFHALRDFAAEHKEAKLIFAAID